MSAVVSVGSGSGACFNNVTQKPVTKVAVGPDQRVGEAVVRRFALQSAARDLLPLERVAGCCRWHQGGRDSVEVWHLPALQRARFGGLQTCGSVWMCPVCAAKITERRRSEVAAALESARSLGLVPVLVTYTVQHYAQDGLRTLLDGLSRARSRATGGKVAKALRGACGVRGHIRALEVTFGSNGWHPHIHELMFLDSSDHLDRLTAGLARQWEKAVSLAGLRDVNSHGIDVRKTDDEIADYLAKFGREPAWQVEHELTKHPSKLGRANSSRTPMQLLADYMAGDQFAGAVWSDYASSMKGCRWLVWSRGLRDLLGLVPEISDQDLAEEVSEEGLLLANLSLPDWRLVLAHEKRAELLNLAAKGNPALIQAFVAELELSPLARRVRWSSSAAGSRSGCDRSQEQEEAASLGLAWSQYRMWQRGGLSSIARAEESPAGGSTRSGGHQRRPSSRRKEVIPCESIALTVNQMELC